MIFGVNRARRPWCFLKASRRANAPARQCDQRITMPVALLLHPVQPGAVTFKKQRCFSARASGEVGSAQPSSRMSNAPLDDLDRKLTNRTDK